MFFTSLDHRYMTIDSSMDLMVERPNYGANAPIPIKSKAFIQPIDSLKAQRSSKLSFRHKNYHQGIGQIKRSPKVAKATLEYISNNIINQPAFVSKDDGLLEILRKDNPNSYKEPEFRS